VVVPVRLSASTFASSADPASETTDALADDLDNWLVEHIVLTYRLSRATARGLVANGLVLPVIDGVNEMDPPGTPLHRAAILLSALNQPTAQGAPAVVLTCRDDRYDDLATTPPTRNVDRSVLQDATIVHIKPMTPSDVHTYLPRRFPDPAGSDRGDPRWRPVLDRLVAGRPDDPVVTALQSPLLLFLAVTAFRLPGSAPGSLVRHLEEHDAHAWLLTRLIPALAAARPQHGRRYPVDDVMRWLNALARSLHREELAGRSGADFRLDGAWRAAGDRLTRYVTATVMTAIAAIPLYLLWIRHLVSVGLPRDAFIAAGITISLSLIAVIAANCLRSNTRMHRLVIRQVFTSSGRRSFTRWLTAGVAIGIIFGLLVQLAGGFAGGFGADLAEAMTFGAIGGLGFGVSLGLAF
jgi:hypothetical protein